MRIISLLLLLCGIAWAQRDTREAGRFDEPMANFASPQALDQLRQLLDQGRSGEAAGMAEDLLANHSESLLKDEAGGLQTVATVLERLPAPQREALAREYRKRFDARARDALEAARDDADASASPLYAMARRYPGSSAAGQAMAEAASRLALRGDAPGALALFTCAQREGWTLDVSQAKQADACRKFIAEVSGAASYRGALPFEMTWYGRPELAQQARYLPLTVDGIIYAAGPRHVLALKDNRVHWRWTAGTDWAVSGPGDRAAGAGRGSTHALALFASPAGPQMLIVKQPRGSARDQILRAFRATDGKLLWSTDNLQGMENISFASAPRIDGGEVRALALEFSEDAGVLVLVTLDLMSGRMLHRAALGTMQGMKKTRTEFIGWDDFWDQSEVAVHEDLVLATPNVGWVFAVGRFDGRLRWMQRYVRAEGDPEKRRDWLRTAAPTDPNQLLRYRCTPAVCGQFIVIAPQDSPAVFGLDLSGRIKWEIKTPPGHTLIGGVGAIAVLAGNSITGIDAATGQPKWTWQAARVAGPPAIVGELMIVPTSDFKVVALSAATGQPVELKARPPNLRVMLNVELVKRAMDEIGVLRTLGLPGTKK